MIEQETLLVILVHLIDRLPMPAASGQRKRGRPQTYSERLFLTALVIMIVRHLHTVHELLSVLAEPTAEMRTLHPLLTVDERLPTRRTCERHLRAVPATLSAHRLAVWGVRS